jgi:hypothetical protein
VTANSSHSIGLVVGGDEVYNGVHSNFFESAASFASDDMPESAAGESATAEGATIHGLRVADGAIAAERRARVLCRPAG